MARRTRSFSCLVLAGILLGPLALNIQAPDEGMHVAARLHDRGQVLHFSSHTFDPALDPEALTIGFARRFATYKRAALILRDREDFMTLARALAAELVQRGATLVVVAAGEPALHPGPDFLAEPAELRLPAGQREHPRVPG